MGIETNLQVATFRETQIQISNWETGDAKTQPLVEPKQQASLWLQHKNHEFCTPLRFTSSNTKIPKSIDTILKIYNTYFHESLNLEDSLYLECSMLPN
jgi:hypothetical protein